MKKKPLLYLLIILLIGGFFRFWQLGTIPAGLSDDEARYIYSSYSIWETGKDVAGKFLPLSINLDNSFSPVYIYADAPFVGLFGLSPLTGRLPYTLVSFLSIIALYFLARAITKNEFIALASAFVLAVSPWHTILSRGALDADFALFFYLLGLYLFITKVKNGNVLWSLPSFLIAFYSYHATKIFFFFLVPLLIIYFWKQLVAKKKVFLGFILGSFLIIASFSWVVVQQSVTRQQVMLWTDTMHASEIVNTERTYSIAPEIIKSIYNNKLLYFARTFRENYFEAFSPQVLFLYGDTDGIKLQFSLLSRGAMHLPEALFLLAGLYAVIRLRKHQILLYLLAIAPLPAAFTIDRSYVNRAIMMLPFLSILVGYGMFYLYNHVLQLHQRLKLFVVALGIIIYAFFISSFFYQYFYQFPLTASEAWGGSSLDLTNFLKANIHKYQDVYIDGAAKPFLLHYAIYNSIAPVLVSEAINKFPSTQIGQIHFVDVCQQTKEQHKDPYTLYKKGTLLIANEKCYPDATPSATITDRGEMLRKIWRIYSF